MMESDYTTVSKSPVDGWLGFFVGSELWYSLFEQSHIESAGQEISKIVSKLTDEISSSSSSILHSISQPLITNTPSTTPSKMNSFAEVITYNSSNSNIIDYEAAWSILQNPSNIGDVTGEYYTYLDRIIS